MAKTTKAQFLKEMAEREIRLRKLISSATMGGFDDNSSAARKARRERCRDNPEQFLQTYLPHYAVVKSAPFHPEIDKAGEIRNRIAVIAAFRGSAKTTRALILDYLMDICYEREPFVLIGSETENQAANFVMQIRIELEENDRIKCDFFDGEIPKGPKWGDNNLITSNGVRVTSRSVKQRVRGMIHRGQRPTKMTVDDIEDDESARSPDQTKAKLNWIKSKVLPGFDPRGWKLRVLGNIFHNQGVLARLVKDEDENGRKRYFSLVINAEDEEGNPTWPDWFPRETLASIKSQIGTVAYNKEYMNRPTDPGGLFLEEWLVACAYKFADLKTGNLQIVLAIDPALGIPGKDYSAVVALGFDPTQGLYFLVACYIKIARPRKTAEVAKEMSGPPLEPICLAVESNGFQELLADHAAELLSHLPVAKIAHYEKSKESRIAELSFPIEMAKIRFDRTVGDTQLLIDQLLYYGGAGVKDDGPDALQVAYERLQRLLCGGSAYESVRKRETEKQLEGWL